MGYRIAQRHSSNGSPFQGGGICRTIPVHEETAVGGDTCCSAIDDNGRVAALLPAFGFDLEEAGMMKTLEVLDIAWQHKYNQYEGALYVAYLVFSGMLKSGNEKTNFVKQQIGRLQVDWVEKKLVRTELATRFTSKADEWLQAQHG